MIHRPRVLFLVLVGCSGLSIDPERALERALGQTDRSSAKAGQSSDAWRSRAEAAARQAQANDWFGGAVAVAEEAAREAREQLERAQQELDTNMTLRQIEAVDSHAQAEAHSEFARQEKLQGVLSSMSHEFDATVREVAHRVKSDQETERRKLAAYDKFMKKMERMEETDSEKAARELAKEQHRELTLERMAMKDFQKEEKIEAKEMAQMKKELQKAEVHEKVIKKHRAEKEGEISARLWDEAEDLRVNASNLSNGTLSQDEVLSLLDISADELNNMTETISNLSGDTGAWFEERLRGIRYRSTTASAHLLQAITANVQELRSHHQDLTDAQLQHQIVRLLNETRNEVKLLQLESTAIHRRIDGWGRASPEKLSVALAGALDGVTNNVEFQNHLFEVDLGRLSHASQTEACRMLSALFMEDMQPAYRSIWRMREKLDLLTRVVPSALAGTPEGMDVVAGRTRDLLNMAYAQHLALEQASRAVLAEAGPVIVDRLKCVFSGTPHAAPGLLAAALVAAAGWLAAW